MARRDAADAATEKALAELEKKLAEIYARADKELAEKTDKYFERFAVLDRQKRILVDAGKLSEKDYQAWRQAKIATGEHWKEMQRQIAERMTQADRDAMAYLNGRLPEIYAMNYDALASSIQKQLGEGYSFELVDAATVRNLATSDKTILPYKTVDGKKAERWHTQRVNAEVMQGILQGESIPQIAKRLKTNVGMSARGSAVRNARTAVTSAENKGRMDMLHDARDKGVLANKVWIAAHDSRTREAHLALDGTEAEVDDPFVNEFGEIMYPGDPDAAPANTYCCRCSLGYKVVGFRKEEESLQEEFGIEQLREIAESSEDKYDFWLSLDENQQAVFKASGMSLDDAFNTLHSTKPISEWKAPNPGGPESFAIKHDFSNAKVEFNPVKARTEGWMADANSAGVINVREDGLGDSWEFIISHEAGHQISNFSNEIQQTILMNPGNVFGRYNTRVMAFDGVYGEYNPEEAFATCVSNYVRHPNSMKEKYPDAYDAIDRLFSESPSALDFVLRTMKEYERRFR